MACYAIKAIQIAKAEDGYREGKNNWNKYADALDKTDMYNFPKQNIPYCDTFFDWSIWEACDRNTDEARYVLCQPKKSAGAGCKYSYGYYKKAGRVGKEPKLGSQIFFGTSESDIYHTGIVIGIKNGKVITEEGNSGNEVKQHTYTIGAKNSKIFGYGYPRYTEEEQEMPPEEPTEPLKSLSEIANEVIEGKWGNGTERKSRLTMAGYKYDEVQAEVNRILKAKTSSAPAKTKFTVKTKTGMPLRLREKASTSSKILALIPNGKTITGTEANGWVKTSYNGKNGYCSADFLIRR